MATTTSNAGNRLNHWRHGRRPTRALAGLRPNTGSIARPGIGLGATQGASQDLNSIKPRSTPARWMLALAVTMLPGGLLALMGLASLKREHARQELCRAARHMRGRDRLTRLYDSAEFITQSRRELVRTVDMQCPVSLILVDTDDVGAILRTHGVETVNRALANIADICVSRLRGYDVIGRLDGQLIALLLPGADAHRAQSVARTLQRRRKACRATPR